MKKELISIFILGFVSLSISLIILKTGCNLYGEDANLLWAMGILAFIGIKGIVEAFKPFINKKHTNSIKSEEKNE